MKHKSEDFTISAIEYYLVEDKSHEEVYKILKCSPRSLIR
jgi:transposase